MAARTRSTANGSALISFVIIAVFSANLTKKESVYLMDSFVNGSICNAVPYHNRIAEGHSFGKPFREGP